MIQAAAITFTIVLPLSLAGVALWTYLKRRKESEGAIHLPEDEEDARPPVNASNDAPSRNVGRVWGRKSLSVATG